MPDRGDRLTTHRLQDSDVEYELLRTDWSHTRSKAG
jgi:hypothetical protein